jgi:hypothetical protein
MQAGYHCDLSSPDINFYFNRHPGAKRHIGIFMSTPIKLNFYWYALRNFSEIAGGVIGGDQ